MAKKKAKSRKSRPSEIDILTERVDKMNERINRLVDAINKSKRIKDI